MPKSPPKVPGLTSGRIVLEDGREVRAGESFVIPLCSLHGTKTVRDDAGQWVCPTCADAWLKEYVENKTRGKSVGGVVLPTGVADTRRENPSFRDLMPNRAARRRAARARRNHG